MEELPKRIPVEPVQSPSEWAAPTGVPAELPPPVASDHLLPPPSGEPINTELPKHIIEQKTQNQAKLEELREHGRHVRFGREIYELASEEDNFLKKITDYRVQHKLPEYRAAQDKVGRERAEELAVTDELTGLLNRRGLLRELTTILKAEDFDPERYVAMYMDLNGFKPINDKYGHDAGDKVLRGVGKRLQLRNSDKVARIGGDEFVVIADTHRSAPDRRDSDRPEANPRRTPKTRDEVIKGIANHLGTEVSKGGMDAGYFSISASTGVQELHKGDNALDVINAADKLMQENKRLSQADR